MKKTILVPLDGSQLAEQVLPYATALANNTGAGLLLLSVVVPAETWLEAGGFPGADERLRAESEAASAYLKSVKERTWNHGPEVRTRVVLGRAADTIRATAASEGAEFIAMTTHGRSGLPRLVMGSVTGEVVRTAGLPVLLVRAVEGAEPTEVHLKRILLPVDGSPTSESVVPLAVELAKRFGAEVIVQRVVAPSAVVFDVGIIPSTPGVLEQIETEAKEYVARLTDGLSRQGIATRQDVRMGYPAQVILAAAKDYAVDLVVMGTHSRTGLGRWLFGSTANGVVTGAEVPCLLVRPPEPDSETTQPDPTVEVTSGFPVPLTVPLAPDLVNYEVDPDAQLAWAPLITHRPERRTR